MLRYLARAILNFPSTQLLFLERFKMKASKNSSDYEYFGILKVKETRGFTVSAQTVKGEIELRMTEVIEIFASAYGIHEAMLTQ
jgi:hypothetical protein